MAVSVKIDDDLKGRIQKLAATRRRSAHWIMREAIEQYVAREEARQSFVDEAHEAWAEFRATGLHLTGEETRAWLETWGTEAEAEAPECHD